MDFNRTRVQHFKRLNDLFLHRYERYLPTAFDSSDSILEKINKMIHFLNEVVEHINDQSMRLEKWQVMLLEELGLTLDDYRKELDDLKNEYEQFRQDILDDILPESVKNKLEEWLEDGTIEELINQTIFGNIMDRLNILENRLISVKFSVKDFGALGDGVKDDTNAFRLAAQSGQSVSVPEGDYIISGIVEMEEGTHFVGEGDNSVIKFKEGNNRHVLFRATGSFDSQVPLTQNSELGDHFVTVGNPNYFDTGDFIRVMSQRTAMGITDPTYDTSLGTKTGTSHRVYFGEYQQISAKNEPTGELFFRGGLNFRDYLTHNNNESDPDSRQNSTVQKVFFKENVRVSKMKIDGPFSTVLMLDTCHDSGIDHVKWVNAEDGDFVNFRESYQCEAYKCSVYYRADVPYQTYYSRNGFKIQSSQYCGFDSCYMKHGSQCVDFTYNGFRPTIPNMYCYLKNSTIDSGIRDGVTAHGGSFAPIITNNQILNCVENGIMVRSPESTITNNIITGTPRQRAPLTVGINLFQFAVRNCKISDNTIKNFLTGIGTQEGSAFGFYELNLMITDNVLTRCNNGIWIRRNANASRFNKRLNIHIVGNKISDPIHEYGKGVQLGDGVIGVKIKDNLFASLPSNTPYKQGMNGGIYTGANCFDIEIRGNTFTGRIIWNPVDLGGMTDTETYPDGRYYFVFDDTNIWSGRDQDIRLRGDNPLTKVDKIIINNTNF